MQLNMFACARQALAIAILIATAPTASLSRENEESYAQQLRAGCDQLLKSAVRRPYGIAWDSNLSGSSDRKPIVALDAPGTAGAGLVLLWAGTLLDEPRYIEAGVDAARAFVAVQAPNGNFPSHPQFGPSPGGGERGGAISSRSSTRAGLVLILGAIGAHPTRDAMFKRSAQRAATWLARQQTNDGAWPATAPSEAGADPHRRLIRLDSTDWRDSIFALLLAREALDDKHASRAVDRAVEKLIALRLAEPRDLRKLWSHHYRLDGSIETELANFPAGADVLASRRAIEALLAASLLRENDSAGVAARNAVQALGKLRDAEGAWRRLYPLDGKTPETPGDPVFGMPATQPADALWHRGTFGLDDVIHMSETLQNLGRERLIDDLAGGLTLQQRLAAAACGLNDEPFVSTWPRKAGEVDAFLAAHEADWRRTEDGGAELHNRVRHLHRLLLRARLEGLRGS